MMLYTGWAAIIKKDKFACPHGVYVLMGEKDSKQQKEVNTIILDSDGAVKQLKWDKQLFWVYPQPSLGIESSLFWCNDLSTF